MTTQILWNPEKGHCDRCGRSCEHTRRFTANGQSTHFCSICWDIYVEECNVPSGQWKRAVRKDWSADVALELVFDEEADGTAPDPGRWN